MGNEYKELAVLGCRKYKHATARSPEYGTWYKMVRRCHDPKDQSYSLYGGRGITVCDRWLGKNGFDTFYLDMGKRPDGKMSLDRIDNDGIYSPENCRWATPVQQANNRRTNVYLTIAGNKDSVYNWSEFSGIEQAIIRARIRDGWSHKDAVFAPVKETPTIDNGAAYGEWTVVNNEERRNKKGNMLCLCKCSCGKEVLVEIYNLKEGKSTKCNSCARKICGGKRNYPIASITIDGETMSVIDCAAKYGVPYATIRSRLDRGLEPEKAVLASK